jgi:hypothetical protein
MSSKSRSSRSSKAGARSSLRCRRVKVKSQIKGRKGIR